MKKKWNGLCVRYGLKTNLFLKMKLLAFILFVSIVSVSANGYSQQIKLSLSLKEVTVKQVFQEIEKNSEFIFIYSEKSVDINRKVSISAEQENVESILGQLFEGTKNYFEINERQITVLKKKQSEIKKVSPKKVTNRVNQPQKKTIKGKVTDNRGEPLPGVTIVIKETIDGITTDVDGNYALEVSDEAEVLIFSFVGMKRQEVPIAGRTQIDVVLEQDAIGVDEVVVTALGIERDVKALGYSVQELEGVVAKESGEMNVVNSLAGRVPGVQINAAGSGADGSSSIIIRGQNSLRGNNQPLFVIDGVQIDNNQGGLTGGDTGIDLGNNISDINPDDIETISILKGANAAALYGSRASNGVVLITTKKGGKQDGVGIRFSTSYAVENAYDILPLQDIYGSGEGERFTDGFFTLAQDGTPRLGVSWNNFGPKMDGTTVVDFTGEKKSYVPQPNNIHDLYRQGSIKTNNVSFSGGNNDGSSTYRIAYTNRMRDGIFRGNKTEKNTINFRGFQQVSKILSSDISITYTNSKGEGRPTVGNSPHLNRYAGFFPRDVSHEVYRNNYEIDGNRNFACPWCYTNSYWILNKTGNNDETDRLIGTIDLNFDITNWLVLKLKGSMDDINRIFEEYASSNSASGAGTEAFFSRSSSKTRQRTFEFLLSTNKKLGDNFLITTNAGGQSWRSETTSFLSKTFGGLTVPNFFSISNSAQNPLTSTTLSDRKINSLYGFGQIAFKNLWFLDVTARNDWSSTLPTDNNSFFYPSVSTSFIITDALSLNSKVLTFAKLRASYAETGSGAATPYVLNSTYGSTGNFMGQAMSSAGTSVPNGNLKPERTSSIELGFDSRFFNNRIGLDLTWYTSSTVDQILPIDVPTSSGAVSALVNAGEIENKGLEIALNATIIQSTDFDWNIGFNYGSNNNKVVDLNGLEALPIAQNGDGPVVVEARPGKPYGDIVTWVPLRNDNGDIIVGSDGQYKNFYERKVVGNIQADWTGGITNDIKFKNFTFNSLIDISMGGEYYSYTKRWITARGSSEESLFGRDASTGGLAWTDSQGRTRNDGVMAEGVLEDGSPNNKIVSVTSFYNLSYQNNFPEHILDASYVMLRELSIGYNLPASLLDKTPLKRVKLSLYGRNLAILYNASKINNPVGFSYSAGNGFTGIEAGSFAPSRTFGFNLNVSF